MADEILLVGLEREAASIALALRTPKLEVSLAGYDPDKKVGREALQAKRVDRVLGSLREASPACDLCLVSLPPEDMIPALETLGAVLPDGALILGVSAIQSPFVAWVKEHLPVGRHYVGIHPLEGASAVQGTAPQDDAPRADRFSGGVMALVLPPGTPQASIDVALSLAAMLGARPFFIDPVELDAATAAVATLPALLAPALMSMSTRQPGWRDARRFTGTTFARATALIDDAASLLSPASLMLQRDYLLPRLEAMQAELAEWRALIEAGTDEALEQRLRAQPPAAMMTGCPPAARATGAPKRCRRHRPSRVPACWSACSVSGAVAANRPRVEARLGGPIGGAYNPADAALLLLHPRVRRWQPVHRADHRSGAPSAPAHRGPRGALHPLPPARQPGRRRRASGPGYRHAARARPQGPARAGASWNSSGCARPAPASSPRRRSMPESANTQWITEELDGLRQAGLFTHIRTLTSPQGAWLIVDGKQVLNFCSNNYLGLANHPRLVEAAKQAIDRYGVGPAAVRTIAGTMSLHLELERRLAAFKGVEAAITFQSGFTANLGTHPGAGRQGRRDLLRRAQPRQHHRRQPPLRAPRSCATPTPIPPICGGRSRPARPPATGAAWSITDGVFSMDGDIAPLDAILRRRPTSTTCC